MQAIDASTDACARCGGPPIKLARPPKLLTWLTAPLLIGFIGSSKAAYQAQAAYCPACRRRINLCLVFLVFLTGLLATVILFQ